MIKSDFKNLLKRYLTDACTEEERLLVDSWYELIGEEKEVEPSDLTALENKLWNSIQSKTTVFTDEQAHDKSYRIQQKPWFASPYIQIAASLLFLMALAWNWLLPKVTPMMPMEKIVYQQSIYNQEAKPLVTWLEDSTKVTLQPNSKLDIPVAFSNHTKREVNLTGEAIFEVRKNPNKPFLVYTGEVVTRVLGTSFRIVNTEKRENIQVEVLTGQVSVYKKGKIAKEQEKSNGVVLTPNQKVTYYKENQHFVVAVVDAPILLNNVMKEKKHKPDFVYKDTPIEAVVTQLELNYGIHIVVDNERFNNCPLTANLSNQPLFSKLEMICTSLNATYEVKGTTILINGRGCN